MSDRREEVIQYAYTTHGRRHAAQVANGVVGGRPDAAARPVGGHHQDLRLLGRGRPQSSAAQETSRKKISYTSRNVTTTIMPTLNWCHHHRPAPVAG
jgi:hypothetical protein